MRVLCALGLFLTLMHVSSPLLLGAFNIKSFGDKKSSNSTIMNIISKSLVLRQSWCPNLHPGGSPEFRYSHIVSEPLGRSTYKERYLFLYREETVSVVKNYTYDDGCESSGTDVFNREPSVVMFSSAHTAVRSFVLIPQHTSPDFAVKEVDALYDVVADVRSRWNTNDIVLLGDFNAGCSYVSGSDWQQIRLFTDKSFHWLITSEADTTVSHTSCPYDRIVVTADMMRGVVHSSAEVYDYMRDMSLSHSLALAVSDHFPVEVKLVGPARARSA
nr:PREDICTED: deoxyribonuclease-1 [Paralichthys olivaceus]